jgi:outer membrane lipoprotein-sorting protein
MNEFPEDELVRRLERLGALEPAPEATRRSVERARQALVESPAAPPRRTIMLKRLTAAAAILLVAGGLFAWWLSVSPGVAIAFADVQAAVKASASLTGRQTIRVKGKPEEVVRFRVLGDGRCRLEETDGSYNVTDPTSHSVLLVNPGKRQATLMRGVNTPSMNFYDVLRKLPADAKARPLPARKLDGKDVLGFAVPAPAESNCFQGLELTVWADAKSRLPVRIEAAATDEKGNAVEIVLDQLVFDQALDAKPFALEAPAGYTLKSSGTAEFPIPPADPALRELVITPREGIGPVRFGMSRAEVEKALGKADGAEEVGRNGFVNLSYASRGFYIGVSKALGVLTITCASQQTTIARLRDFSGKTDKGIGLGARIAEVIQVYGKPDRKETNQGSTYLSYNQLHADFTFFGDRLVQMYFRRPR